MNLKWRWSENLNPQALPHVVNVECSLCQQVVVGAGGCL